MEERRRKKLSFFLFAFVSLSLGRWMRSRRGSMTSARRDPEKLGTAATACGVRAWKEKKETEDEFEQGKSSKEGEKRNFAPGELSAPHFSTSPLPSRAKKKKRRRFSLLQVLPSVLALSLRSPFLSLSPDGNASTAQRSLEWSRRPSRGRSRRCRRPSLRHLILRRRRRRRFLFLLPSPHSSSRLAARRRGGAPSPCSSRPARARPLRRPRARAAAALEGGGPPRREL